MDGWAHQLTGYQKTESIKKIHLWNMWKGVHFIFKPAQAYHHHCGEKPFIVSICVNIGSSLIKPISSEKAPHPVSQIIQSMLFSDTDNLLLVWDNLLSLQLLSNLDNLVSKKGKVWSMTKLLSVPTSLSDLDNLVIWSPVQAIHVGPFYVFFKSAIFHNLFQLFSILQSKLTHV